MSLRLILFLSVAVVVILALTQNSEAQTARPATASSTSASMPMLEKRSPWSGSVRYGLSSDYANNRSPRAYENILIGDIGYQLSPRWSLGLSASLRAITLDGQIPKDREQDYTETIEPGTSLEVAYSVPFYQTHNFSVSAHGEPLWAKDSRLEGHRGLLGVGTAVTFGFFARQFTMTHALDATSLINTYSTGSNGVANPDYFYTYKWINAFRFFKTYKISYTFGAKVTRYLDDFVGYSYNNTLSLSKSWQSFSASMSYDNGGFTDDGYLRLWYIDDYRRVIRIMVSYAF